jgi:Arc/MetJ-type ribon-helix-helix transcriptional regulator
LTKQKTKVVATRVTEHYAQVLEEYARKDAYINCSDLLRDALREKLQRDAPELYRQVLWGTGCQ